jgi:hypothetical protein
MRISLFFSKKKKVRSLCGGQINGLRVFTKTILIYIFEHHSNSKASVNGLCPVMCINYYFSLYFLNVRFKSYKYTHNNLLFTCESFYIF